MVSEKKEKENAVELAESNIKNTLQSELAEKDKELIVKRLKEKFNLKPDFYRYYGDYKSKRFFKDRNLNSLNTVGYKELFDCFEGNITQEKAIELIKKGKGKVTGNRGPTIQGHLFSR